MRLIDADALILKLKEQDYSGSPDTLEEWTPQDLTRVEILDIKDAPTIDAVPVVHGHWEKIEIIDDDSDSGVNDEAARCSVCEGVQGSYYWATNYYKYCPNCGAKMDGEVSEEGKNE